MKVVRPHKRSFRNGPCQNLTPFALIETEEYTLTDLSDDCAPAACGRLSVCPLYVTSEVRQLPDSIAKKR